ncbi:tRNA (N(6)-L-threonylcarbamoyladenosine(37)-C(2))-methylthiotransferase MtaB [Magnetococcus sp. PR-3]|uniref:tRNA (N(6)-L-threonylcarbamoyladenosine(37)-C(2))- methylthiotransferase MtaB n=1 Tax=Magnetococcus sp. PR-3 TaxID=3120355 RepID=UPI002FCE485B
MDDPKDTKKPLSIINMGCRVNQFEGAAMQAEAAQAGYTRAEAGDTPQVVIVNTCSVTAESDSQARKQIRRIGRDNPGARILVTGCYAQRNPEVLADLPGVELVFGNQEKKGIRQELAILDAKEVPQQPSQHVAPMDRTPLTEEDAPTPDGPLISPDAFKGQARAFVQVQNGCDKRCTFCLIPSVRGASRSQSPQWVKDQAQTFVQGGYQELVLTGIDLGSYGRELGQGWSLAQLVETLLTLKDLPRIRISSIDPMDIDEAFVALMGREPRLCPHLHLSMQSGDDMVLKRMHRGSNRAALIDRVQRLRAVRPELVLGADVIVGFPTETTEAFEQSCNLIEQLQIPLLHIFRYSDRPDTPATEIPRRFRVADQEIKARAKQLAEVGKQVWTEVAQARVGTSQRVLVEQTNQKGLVLGKTDAFLDVAVANAQAQPGQLQTVKITGVDVENRQLLAVPVA